MQMTDEEFEVALKQMPCPECREIGHLTSQQMQFKLTYKGYPIEVEGEGWICMDGCDQKFMSDDMTEQFANQTWEIDDGGRRQYVVVDRETGIMTSQPLH